jgi:hypothetical protein
MPWTASPQGVGRELLSLWTASPVGVAAAGVRAHGGGGGVGSNVNAVGCWMLEIRTRRIMQREIASGIIELMTEYSAKLNQSAQLVKDSCPTEEFQEYRTAVGQIMGTMYVDIMRPIFKEHPDLEPEWHKR